jgi:hypothetical protein
MDLSALSWKRFKRNPANNMKLQGQLNCQFDDTEESMSLDHHPERATHHRSLDMLMEVHFVLEHTERSASRLRALGQEVPVSTLETRSEFEQLQRGIHGLPAVQALAQAEAIRARAAALFVVLQA